MGSSGVPCACFPTGVACMLCNICQAFRPPGPPSILGFQVRDRPRALPVFPDPHQTQNNGGYCDQAQGEVGATQENDEWG
ncbi:hypothetical protein BOTBODRAFT_218028 [Botryobasidium botryosum FD-172 SS1]|uniref:Uncharacterized protein n=1 Tax=Botryobasidium botryosum (strain FD-172 SS1) TaxID=930990 RepID=A0A067N1S7_BOTB1|nr:hypothetical protein BOTBODRAFT_218028 [Botryobasidium botryosum FD-172 SS1]